jgi:hypothetical protein
LAVTGRYRQFKRNPESVTHVITCVTVFAERRLQGSDSDKVPRSVKQTDFTERKISYGFWQFKDELFAGAICHGKHIGGMYGSPPKVCLRHAWGIAIIRT